MYCHRCGKQIKDGSNNCIFCGAAMPDIDTRSIYQSTPNVETKGKAEKEKELNNNETAQEFMKTSWATLITFLADFLVLCFGSLFIVLIGTGGFIVFLIEFYFIKAFHKAVYRALTGKEWGKEDKSTDSHTIDSSKTQIGQNTESNRLSQTEIEESKTTQNNLLQETVDEDIEVVEFESVSPQINNNLCQQRIFESASDVPVQSQSYIPASQSVIINKRNNTNNNSPAQSPFPKIIHDVNIDFSKTVTFCILAFILSIIICVCIIKCSNQNDNTVYNTKEIISEESETTTPPTYENEEERWDAENCIYANFKYGIALNLPKFMAWHKISGTAKHTVVKFVQPESQLTIFVNVNPLEQNNSEKLVDDIWAVYDDFVKLISYLTQNTVNTNSAERIVDQDFSRAVFCGKHAIKDVYKSIYDDDRYNEKRPLTTIDYTFIYNQTITTYTIKCYDEVIGVLKDNGIAFEDFLKCFQLTPISDDFS